MGMRMQLRRAKADIVQALESEEGAFERFLFPDDYEALEKEQKLIDLGKSWHVIHFLLSGTAWGDSLPDGALLAGRPVSDDLGYGPARLLSGSEVKSLASLLANKPDDFIAQNLDYEKLQEAEIYPSIGDRRDPEDERYVSAYFLQLKSFISAAAKDEECVILAIL